MKNLWFILIFIITISIKAQWMQLGNNINGVAALDQSGYRVSLSADGSIIAIGAYLNDSNGIDSGQVRVYENNGGIWNQIGNDINGESANDQSGRALSISADGSVVAIGAMYNSGNGTNSGHVRIFENIGGNWVQIGNDIDGEAANDFSGYSVSLNADGTIVAIGSVNSSVNGAGSGHVRIFQNNAGNWIQIGGNIAGESAGDYSGYSVSLNADGTVVAIGAYKNAGNGTNAGHVRVYQNIGGNWVQIGNDIDGEAANDYSGTSVSLNADGTIVAIGAYANDGNGVDAGQVRVYQNISGTWTQIGNDIDGENAGEHFGISVSLNDAGNILAVGAPTSNSNTGLTRVYENISGAWTKVGSDILGEAVDDLSGTSVSLNSDGSIVAIGAPGNDGNGSASGNARVFTYDNGNNQTQWTTDTTVNTEVSTYESQNQDMKSIALDNGRTAIVYWKEVSTGGNYELWLQIMNANGNKELGPDGIMISNTIPMSTYVNFWSLTKDDNNNIYIGVTGTNGDVGIAFKLDKNGNHLWPTNGINLGSGFLVTILPLSDGNALISWLDGNAYTSYMQKFDSNGNAIWTNNVLLDPNGYTAPANLFELSNGDILAIYHQRSYGVNSTLWAQRYTSGGNYVWSNPIQISTKTTAYNAFYSPAQVGDTIFFGYVGKSGSRFDSYIQKINPDGTLPWGADGLDFDINQTNYEMDTQIYIEDGSQYLWAICSYTNSAQDQYGEYVQKIDITNGTRLFTDNAKVLYNIGSQKTHEGKLWVYNDNPLFLLEDGVNNGINEIILNIIKLDSNGDFYWTDEFKPIATNPGTNKKGAILNEKYNNQSVVVFNENKSGGSDFKIYAQNFIDDTNTGGIVKDNDLKNISFNNPVTDILQINSFEKISEISFYDLSGKQILKEKNINKLKININVSKWTKGLYIMKINKSFSYLILKK